MSIFEWMHRLLPWSSVVGPLWIGPLTSGLLLSTALLCVIYAWQVRRSPPTYRGALQRFYYSQTCLLLALGLDKQWGLLDRLTSYYRSWALNQGWYSTRHAFQVDVIVGILLVSVLLLGVACWCFRIILRHQWLPLVGALGLLAYVAIRAVSLHDVDALLADRVWGVRRDWLFELGGSLFLFCALILAFSVQQRSSNRWRRLGSSMSHRHVSSA